MITPAQRAELRRLYYGEHWKMGTIAAQLGLHRETVRAAVEHETGGVHRGVCRPSALDPYLPLLRNTLAQYPRLRATRRRPAQRDLEKERNATKGEPMNAERLNEVARIVEGLRPRGGADGDRFSEPFQRTGTQMLVADADIHTRITHLHMGVYHGSQDCGTVGCIAGVTIQRWPEEAATYGASSTNVAVADDVAGQILGLRPEVAEVLFHCRNHRGYWALGLIRPEEAATACRRVAAGETLDHIWEQSLPAIGETH